MSEVQELRAGLAKLLYAKVWESSRVGNEWMVGELVFLVMNRCFSRGDFFSTHLFSRALLTRYPKQHGICVRVHKKIASKRSSDEKKKVSVKF